MVSMDEYLAALQGPESGGNLTIRNRASGAEGLYQIMPATQEGLRRQGFNLDMSTPEGQTAAAAELTRQNDVLLRHRLNRDPTDAERYFAHGFGGPAASFLLAHPEMPLESGLRTFYGGTRFGERFADRIFEQNPNLAALRSRPVSEAVADYGNRLHTTGRRQFASAGAAPQVAAGPMPPIRLDGVDVGGGAGDVVAGGGDAASDFDPAVSLMPRVRGMPGDQLAEAVATPAVPADTRARPSGRGALPARPPAGRQPAVPPAAATPVTRALAPEVAAVPVLRPGDAPTPAQVGAYGRPNYGDLPPPPPVPQSPPPNASADDLARALLGAQGPATGVAIDPPAVPPPSEGPQPYVAGGASAIPAPAAPPPPPPPPPAPQLPEVPNITMPALPAVPEPDYNRLYALIERMQNPTRAPRESERERGIQDFFAGLGAGGGSRGHTISEVLGAAGAGAAASRTSRGQEERAAAERYDQALQQGTERAGTLAAAITGQQQQGALTRAQLAQQQQQFGATSAINLYRAQVARMVAQARIDDAHRRALQGEPLSSVAQQVLLDSLSSQFGPQADERGVRMMGEAQWRAFIQTAPGQTQRRSMMREFLTSTPEGRALMERYRHSLTSRLQPGTPALPTDTEE